MANPTLYKKKPIVDIRNRDTTQLTDTEKAEVNTTISKFFELFKSKHL